MPRWLVVCVELRKERRVSRASSFKTRKGRATDVIMKINLGSLWRSLLTKKQILVESFIQTHLWPLIYPLGQNCLGLGQT